MRYYPKPKVIKKKKLSNLVSLSIVEQSPDTFVLLVTYHAGTGHGRYQVDSSWSSLEEAENALEEFNRPLNQAESLEYSKSILNINKK
jgi:hypothetical protein